MGDRSPLMFESDEEDDVETEQITPLEKDDSEEKKSSQESPTKKKVDQLRTVLSGVPPPPTLTFLQMDAKHLLELWNQNIQTFNLQDVAGRDTNLVEKDLSTKSWQESQTDYYYGIYYNRSTLSEQLEALSLKYQERYVGAETSTSVNGLSSRSPPKTASARKRARRLAHGGHSPGRRLSYLARRRNTFSSLDLRSQQPAKMILVNNKAKPNVRKKLRNSATKNVPGGGVALAASIPKRALFQSPENGKKQSKTPVQSSQRTRRALFSSSSSSTRDSMPVLTRQTEPGLKRQRETDAAEQPLQKRDSVIASDLKRRCTRSLLFEENEKSVIPSSPPQLTAQTLSKLHKQKLLWAVSGALREEGIKIKDTLFQPCASLLFNQCKNIWLKESTTNVCKQVTSTSDKMLEIVKRYCSDTVAKVSAKLNKNGGVKSVCGSDRSVCGSLQPAKPPLQTLPQNVLLPPDNKSETTDITKKPCRLTDTKRPADDASLSIGFKNCTSENDSDAQTCTVTNAS